ncbi:MAG: hypothetical protein ACRDF6_12750, partial [bacterium]
MSHRTSGSGTFLERAANRIAWSIAPAQIGLLQPLAQIEGRIQEALRGAVAMGTGELVGGRQEPAQEIEGPGEDGHLGRPSVLLPRERGDQSFRVQSFSVQSNG